jgi:hypothetical protein
LPDASTAPALKTVFAPYFRIGAAVVLEQIDAATHPDDVALLRKHFSSITVANAMKADTIAVAEGQYNFEPADQIVAFAQDNGIEVRAHTLVWHVTSPDWFFAGDRSDPVAYRALVRHRLQTYITDVVTHFKGKVYAWDVVNEVAGTAQGQTYRTDSPWYEAYSVGGGNGADYIEDAFRAARAPDPDVKLFINDFLTENPVKRANVLAIVQGSGRPNPPRSERSQPLLRQLHRRIHDRPERPLGLALYIEQQRVILAFERRPRIVQPGLGVADTPGGDRIKTGIVPAQDVEQFAIGSCLLPGDSVGDAARSVVARH